MDTTETKIDKSAWGPGPWLDEPDRVEWKTQAGLPALAHRNRSGVWCGYVAVPPGHPFHGHKYDDHYDLDVHGGLTYSGACQGHICHVPDPGEPENVWWFGFDCHHAHDFAPAMHAALLAEGIREPSFDKEYRTIDYAKEQCELLARQLAAAAR